MSPFSPRLPQHGDTGQFNPRPLGPPQGSTTVLSTVTLAPCVKTEASPEKRLVSPYSPRHPQDGDTGRFDPRPLRPPQGSTTVSATVTLAPCAKTEVSPEKRSVSPYSPRLPQYGDTGQFNPPPLPFPPSHSLTLKKYQRTGPASFPKFLVAYFKK